MKSKEIRELDVTQLKQQLITKEEELFNLKIQLSTKQLENPMKIRDARRHVARLKTILREKEKGSKAS
ncbi:MAG TPA: 50S ribosomal protein L29 [bacterium]|jgi:large subunit ribosomal protein L29|nr:50S ribosomal protein L29 [bacterium]